VGPRRQRQRALAGVAELGADRWARGRGEGEGDALGRAGRRGLRGLARGRPGSGLNGGRGAASGPRKGGCAGVWARDWAAGKKGGVAKRAGRKWEWAGVRLGWVLVSGWAGFSIFLFLFLFFSKSKSNKV
jgi:hypothetical protein